MNPLDTTIRIQILKYDNTYSWAQNFLSIKRCESEIARLIKI